MFKTVNLSIACALFCLALTGCGEQTAEVSSPNQYNQHGLTFSYPGNWEVEAEVPGNGVVLLTVSTPGDASRLSL